jgi:hypothetical protein
MIRDRATDAFPKRARTAPTTSNFETSQGLGRVWLGSTFGTVVPWSATQIVATVASNSTSGSVQVQQGGVWSNSMPFNVITATVSSASPTSGVSGTQVTITGSGFGASQGGGQVWLGTANGVVQSWSDTQIVAQVAAGSASGNAQVLQNGVWSNAIPFSVNSLRIASVSPTSGLPGTSITISGTGFGTVQGTGTVLLGSANGQVISWSDTAHIFMERSLSSRLHRFDLSRFRFGLNGDHLCRSPRQEPDWQWLFVGSSHVWPCFLWSEVWRRRSLLLYTRCHFLLPSRHQRQ